MKFVYDILLNLNETRVYDFYEWSEKDSIEFFKRIPIFKIDNESYKKIKIGNIIRSDDLLDNIYRETEIYEQKKIVQVDYACVFTNGYSAIGALLNKYGQILMLSKLLLDEEEEVVETSITLEEIKLDVYIKNQNYKDESFLTRIELYKLFFLTREIDNLYTNKKIDKLKYMYYECFNRIEENVDKIYQDLKKFLNGEWTYNHNNLYDLIRLSYSKK